MQCDGCELWLHLNCIGLRPDQVSEDEDFICKDCKPAGGSKKPKVCSSSNNFKIIFLNISIFFSDFKVVNFVGSIMQHYYIAFSAMARTSAHGTLDFTLVSPSPNQDISILF